MMRDRAYEVAHISLFDAGGGFLGCGWALDQCRAITCAHVVSTNSAIQARQSFPPYAISTYFVAATTGQGDPFVDAALLLTNESRGCTQVEWAHGITDPQPKQLFSAFGFPNDKPTLGDFAEYQVATQLPNGWIVVEISKLQGSELREGYSGAPAWDTSIGSIVGIVVGVDPQRRRQIAYLIPPSVLEVQLKIDTIHRPPPLDATLHARVSTITSRDERRRAALYLADLVGEIGDAVERYWLYACLGELMPQSPAREALKHAMSFEQDEFAKRGAAEAISRHHPAEEE